MSDTVFKEKTVVKITRPKMYKVILLNDHYTTMEFVMSVLMDIFNKSETEAFIIMMNVHKSGSGVAGIYSLDIAQTKVKIVKDMARENGYPLKLDIKEE